MVRFDLIACSFLIYQCCLNKAFSILPVSDCLIFIHLLGTIDHIPPEFDRHGNYSAGPTTVWQLGVLLFELLHNKMFKTSSFLQNELKIGKRLSK
ncbi:hypothetical protein XENOCAPTIV_011703, partial [Xenoophorus captivus]